MPEKLSDHRARAAAAGCDGQPLSSYRKAHERPKGSSSARPATAEHMHDDGDDSNGSACEDA
eukprot:scaffold12244_cov216-Isochrysis_galbana.AAC.7